MNTSEWLFWLIGNITVGLLILTVFGWLCERVVFYISKRVIHYYYHYMCSACCDKAKHVTFMDAYPTDNQYAGARFVDKIETIMEK